MYRNKIKTAIICLLLLTCASFMVSLKEVVPVSKGTGNMVWYFKSGAADFLTSTVRLKRVISAIGEDPASIEQGKAALKDCRMQYKKIEFFMAYFFQSSALIYNQPAKVEVEEPYMEYQEPSGFQVMEALLFDAHPALKKVELIAQADLLCSSASDLDNLTYQFVASDAQVLESIRMEVVRVMTLSISGYDAPELKSGIYEAGQSLAAVTEVLQPFLKHTILSHRVSSLLKKSRQYLALNSDFDSFDRMTFLRLYALPLQEQLGKLIRALHEEINTKSALNYQARNLFSKEVFNQTAFSGVAQGKVQAVLGKRLFFEKALSGNLRRNCASCHQPSKYFTDGLTTSLAFNGKSHVTRNAPALFYAGYQYAQFWDGRAKTLQEQIKSVISNPLEMNGDHDVVVQRLRDRKEYGKLTIDGIAEALAAYVFTLQPFNSAFDRYLNGDKQAMNNKQVKGFNLFMGKAQCGTCHFVPLFNGLIPPFYKRTEFEVLGTPGNEDFKNLQKDADPGRFGAFPIEYYRSSFKTPTLRNIAMTAPYMHNGAFKNLQKVMGFYNEGGGTGLGLDIPNQTLSAKPLHLSQHEIEEIIAFLQTLTDLGKH